VVIFIRAPAIAGAAIATTGLGFTVFFTEIVGVLGIVFFYGLSI
jgi:hypothetical protein